MKKRQRYANEFYKIYKNGTNNDTNKDTSTDNNKKTKDNKNNKDNNKKTKDNKNKTTTNKNNDKLNNIVGHGDGGIDSFFTSTLNAVKTSDFGIDNDNYHTGVDYATKEGTDIISPIEGKVVEKKYDKRGFGNTMVIKDKNDKFHRFAHMKDTPSFGLGDKIEKNSVIGKVGNTGNSSGSHLHYQVTDKKGVSINPKDYTGKGGTENKLEEAIITFKESKEKVRVSLDKEDTILRNGTIGKPLIIDEDTPKASVPKNETPIKVPNGSSPGFKFNNPFIFYKGNIPKVEVPTVTKPIDNPIVNIPENNNETYNKKSNSTETNNMIRLVNIIINLLTKVTDNTANIATIVDILKDMMTNYQGKTNMGKGANDIIEQKKEQSKTYPNKYRSSTQKSQVNQIKNLMQKSLTANSTDDTNLEYILNALETLATE